VAAYIPRQGDVLAVTFDPQSGHEQKGRRPALVVSKDLFNRSTGVAIVCSDEVLAEVLSVLDACIY
jgi:mRNA interferase MazF|tara:strand:+ start:1964 stop:2161 length:198 start_codon:yes stop_codon:yes gene_type:complete